ncbi:MAG TPA: Asp-tRNA(Asn)/Glu-tRNA(Gln) amidotransferase subunit GatC [Candidatus Dormibacteraeota bacterium]|jgi:aspartyl-tRNA(Asn)/glutamyl-tRNA(Gln) amidotransferase subunit C|nr:Asp-tRNA(Asn)/Glu-tRNA(Gln) amidotransferase subunit GatC [Candidatus Dormibacteraeota bacterium]
MTLSREQVRHVAMLARLELEPGEEEFYAGQLSGILTHIDRLSELDTDAISPTAQVIEVRNVMRDDEPAECLTPEDALFNAPAGEDGLIVVKAIQDPNP